MSGGEYQYFFRQLEDLSIRKWDGDIRRSCLQNIIDALAVVMKDVEWVDSHDTSRGDENESIDKLLAILGADPVIILKAHAFDKMKDLFNQDAIK